MQSNECERATILEGGAVVSARIVTDAQYKMLCSARKHGNAFHHLRLEEYPAALRTRDLLIDRGWLRFGAVFVEIADAGRKALARIEGGLAWRATKKEMRP